MSNNSDNPRAASPLVDSAQQTAEAPANSELKTQNSKLAEGQALAAHITQLEAELFRLIETQEAQLVGLRQTEQLIARRRQTLAALRTKNSEF
jgi:hypothetical protein